MPQLQSPDLSAVLIALIGGIVTIIATLRGKEAVKARSAPQTGSGMMEVAGAIVSDKAVDRMVNSLDAFTAAATLMTHAIDKDVAAKGKLTDAIDKDVTAKAELTKALNRNSEVSHDMREEIKDTGRKMERLTIELIRAQVKS